MVTAIRNEYQNIGVDTYYIQNADSYENPHSNFALNCLNALWKDEFINVLDFASGDGLISKHLAKNKFCTIVGCDKFLHERYARETGNKSFNYSFEDVANGYAEFPKFDVIVFSYAIDIVEKSYLNNLLYGLSVFSKYLIVIRPNNHSIDNFAWKEEKSVKFGKARGIIYSRTY